MANKEEIFSRLWEDYTTQNPSAKKIYDLFTDKGETVVNDHIAFRTFNHPKIGIDVLSRIFLKAGYQYIQDYHFEAKKLYAKHFEHKEDKDAPRIFISELRLELCSKFLQIAVQGMVNKIDHSNLKSDRMVFSGNIWGNPSFDMYNKLREESEYAAWLYVYGFRANHFTVSVNHLKTYDTVEKVNSFLKENGFLINDSGGEIKGTPAELLEQSSIKADHIMVEFKDGRHEIPGCYYEFAKRYPDKDGRLYSGFIAKSADKIFESTDYYDKK
ncbi:MAG: DUF1338 domain-containing protein [Bacteroidetes bacterium]|nr:DUF1338 domain-containing protein [Bacteroidota bacterium]